MDNLFPLISLVVLVLIFPVARLWTMRRKRELNQVFQTVAQRRNGSVAMERTDSPSLRIDDNGIDIALRFRSVGKRSFTELEAVLDDGAATEFVLETQSALPELDQMFVARAPKTGDKNFDRAFSIQSEDDAWIRSVLTPQVRTSLLRFVRESPSYRIHWKGGKLTLWKHGVLRDAKLVEQYLDVALPAVRALAPALRN